MKLIGALSLLAVAVSGKERGEKIPGEYVVVLKQGISAEARAAHMEKHVDAENVVFEYKSFLSHPSYALKNVTPEKLAYLQNLAEVRMLEPNVYISIEQRPECVQVDTDTWGLQRTSLEGSVPSDRHINDYQYEYDDCGEGVEIHVQDTGILITHEDFAGRAVWGGDWTLEGDFDGHGHGTHVASTAGGARYGIARCSRLHACKVMTADGFGTLFSILGGLTYSSERAQAGIRVVVNLSLGALINPLLNAIADDVVRAGAMLVAAAGNSNDNACFTSPASAELAWTIGSSGPRSNATLGADVRSDFSNWGTCVDQFAPGGLIKAAWIDADPAEPANRQYFIASGTSMACPHAAGVAAKYWSRNPSFSPEQLRRDLNRLAQEDLLQDVGEGSPNRLLFDPCGPRD